MKSIFSFLNSSSRAFPENVVPLLAYQTTRDNQKTHLLKPWSYTSTTLSFFPKRARIASMLFKIPYCFHYPYLKFIASLLRLHYSFYNTTFDRLKWLLSHFPLLEGWCICQFHTTVLIIHLTVQCCTFHVRKHEKTLVLIEEKSTFPEEILCKQNTHRWAKSSSQAP